MRLRSEVRSMRPSVSASILAFNLEVGDTCSTGCFGGAGKNPFANSLNLPDPPPLKSTISMN